MLIAAVCFAIAAYFLVKNETKKEYNEDDLNVEDSEPEPAPRPRRPKPAPEPKPEPEVKTDKPQSDEQPKQ